LFLERASFYPKSVLKQEIDFIQRGSWGRGRRRGQTRALSTDQGASKERISARRVEGPTEDDPGVIAAIVIDFLLTLNLKGERATGEKGP